MRKIIVCCIFVVLLVALICSLDFEQKPIIDDKTEQTTDPVIDDKIDKEKFVIGDIFTGTLKEIVDTTTVDMIIIRPKTTSRLSYKELFFPEDVISLINKFNVSLSFNIQNNNAELPSDIVSLYQTVGETYQFMSSDDTLFTITFYSDKLLVINTKERVFLCSDFKDLNYDEVVESLCI